MKIRHRIVYDKTEVNKKFIKFLKDKNAKFIDDGTDLVVVYVNEEDEWKVELDHFLKEEKIIPDVEAVYSKQEMEEAAWLRIRSKHRWEYPQPENAFEYEHITYDDTDYCDSCGCNLKQKAEFRVKKEPKWGQRHFLMLNWIEDELFVSNVIKDVFLNAGITGAEIYDVLHYRTNIPIENMKQIYVQNVLQPGLINEKISIEKTIKCEKCGCVKYIYTGRGFTYKRDVFNGLDVDIVKSAELFGDGHLCMRLLFISKRLYNLLASKSLDRNLEFEPIFLE